MTVKITEEQCHISPGISGASFSRALIEKIQIDSTSGLEICLMSACHTSALT